MSDETEKAPKKVRMIARKDFAKLRDILKDANKKQEEYQDWVEQAADEMKVWPREWTPRTGEIKRDGSLTSERAPAKITRDARDRLNTIRSKLSKANGLVSDIAAGLGVPVSAINHQTGEIEDLDIDEADEVLADADPAPKGKKKS